MLLFLPLLQKHQSTKLASEKHTKMSLYNHCSSPGYRKYEVPQIVFPSSHESEFKTSNPTRRPILQTNSGTSQLSVSTAATSVSASSIVEIKDSIEEAMSTALFGEVFNRSTGISFLSHVLLVLYFVKFLCLTFLDLILNELILSSHSSHSFHP